MNRLRGGLKIAAVKSPGFGDNRRSTMQDIAVATGGQFISDETGLTLESEDFQLMGTSKNVIITKDDTIIIGGAGEKLMINKRIETIKEQISSTSSENDKEKLQERLDRLTGGVAVINVGGSSEFEVGELKDRI